MFNEITERFRAVDVWQSILEKLKDTFAKCRGIMESRLAYRRDRFPRPPDKQEIGTSKPTLAVTERSISAPGGRRLSLALSDTGGMYRESGLKLQLGVLKGLGFGELPGLWQRQALISIDRS